MDNPSYSLMSREDQATSSPETSRHFASKFKNKLSFKKKKKSKDETPRVAGERPPGSGIEAASDYRGTHMNNYSSLPTSVGSSNCQSLVGFADITPMNSAVQGHTPRKECGDSTPSCTRTNGNIDRVSISGLERCNSLEEMDPQDHIYEPYLPPYLLNKALPSAVMMGDIKTTANRQSPSPHKPVKPEANHVLSENRSTKKNTASTEKELPPVPLRKESLQPENSPVPPPRQSRRYTLRHAATTTPTPSGQIDRIQPAEDETYETVEYSGANVNSSLLDKRVPTSQSVLNSQSKHRLGENDEGVYVTLAVINPAPSSFTEACLGVAMRSGARDDESAKQNRRGSCRNAVVAQSGAVTPQGGATGGLGLSDLFGDGSLGSKSGSDESVFENQSVTDDEEEEVYEDVAIPTNNVYGNVEVQLPVAGEIAPRDKLHHVAHELMTTEAAYVKKLSILQKIRTETERVLGEEIARSMFPFIDSMCQLHKENILPYLEERVRMWEGNKRLGDIMMTFAPYLKVYTDYVKNFDAAIKLVVQWNEKSHEFAKVIRTAQGEGASQSLKLQIEAHMLEPIQRVPRYELLLKQYLKYLPEDSPDRQNVEKALSLVSGAAVHFETMIKHSSKNQRILDLSSQLDSPINLVQSSREIVKEGRLFEINPKTGKLEFRHVVLFNDMLMVCKVLSSRIGSTKPRYRLRTIIDVAGMEIDNGDGEVANILVLKTRKKTIELSAQTVDELMEWQQALFRVVSDLTRKAVDRINLARNNSFRRAVIGSFDEELQIGRHAPVLVQYTEVTMCMLCAGDFTVLIRKKHHCKACGRVICGQCSQFSADLEYDDWRPHRVCEECHSRLKAHASTPDGRGSSNFKVPKIRSRLRELCVHSGHLNISQDLLRTWKRRWIEIHEGGFMYTYKAKQDIVPLYSLNLADCSVYLRALEENQNVQLIKLQADTKVYYFKEDNMDKLARWWKALQETTQHVQGTR